MYEGKAIKDRRGRAARAALLGAVTGLAATLFNGSVVAQLGVGMVLTATLYFYVSPSRLSILRIVVSDLQAAAHGYKKRHRRPGRVLDGFAHLCISPEMRAIVECAAANLRQDVRELRRSKASRLFIWVVRVWLTSATIVPIFWDGLKRLVASALPLVGWLKNIRGT